jgi:hypothetical protein
MLNVNLLHVSLLFEDGTPVLKHVGGQYLSYIVLIKCIRWFLY